MPRKYDAYSLWRNNAPGTFNSEFYHCYNITVVSGMSKIKPIIRKIKPSYYVIFTKFLGEK